MTLEEAIFKRHSVRCYSDKEIEQDKIKDLNNLISQCCKESGEEMYLFTDEPIAFGESRSAHINRFKNVRYYLCMYGDSLSEENFGYYGEKIVLRAQQLGLSSCWTGLAYSKRKIKQIAEKRGINNKKDVYSVITLGYEDDDVNNSLKTKKSRKVTPSDICDDYDKCPYWFKKGMEMVTYAPLASNQLQYRFKYIPDRYVRMSSHWHYFHNIDVGIAKLHFEIGAEGKFFEWLRM